MRTHCRNSIVEGPNVNRLVSRYPSCLCLLATLLRPARSLASILAILAGLILVLRCPLGRHIRRLPYALRVRG